MGFCMICKHSDDEPDEDCGCVLCLHPEPDDEEDDPESESQISPGNQFGYRCPECGADDRIHVVVEVWVCLAPDGTDDADKDVGSDQEWYDDSPAQCRACGWAGMVRDLTTTPKGDT
jgi:hypothetical protein